MTFGTCIHDAQMMYADDFGDPLTFPVVPGQLLDGLSGSDIHVLLRMKCNNIDDPFKSLLI